MPKEYEQIMPLDKTRKIIEQFGWTPESVVVPGKGLEWKEKIGDSGDISTRRSSETKYLPNLRFSEFNPELAENIVRYWSMPNDLIVDPFAGRATRGVVALTLGRKYEGYEVAPTTFASTKEKIETLGGKLFQSDGCKLEFSVAADMIFTCPPYHLLEKYEDAPGQLTNIPDYGVFMKRIQECASNCLRILKKGRFVCFVTADFREGGELKLFHVDSIKAFEAAGFKTWDIVVVKNHSPFTHLQLGKVASKRYTSKTHEYVLVFRK